MEALEMTTAAAAAGKPGYKLTKLGWIPKEWRFTKLSEVGNISSGSTPARSGHEKYYAAGTIPWVKTGDLTRDEIHETEEQITSLALKESSCKLYPSGTVLVAMYGGFKQIGRTGILTADAAINQAISAIEVDSNVLLPEFLLAWLNQNIDYWKNFAASSRKDPNITGKDVQDFPIALPQLSEQRFIVEVAGKFNSCITSTQNLLTAKRTYKRGLMQQLLTGQRRFPEFQGQPWREQRISSLITESRIPGSNGKAAKKLTVRLYGKGVLAKNERQIGSVNTKYYTRRAGQFIYSKLDFLNGAFGLIPEELDGYESTLDLPTFDISPEVDASLLLAYFSREEFYARFADIAAGGRKAVRIGPEDLLKKKILLPSLPEQQRIAAVLTACGQEIELLQAQLRQWQQQKKGLMQQLLTGQLRVKQ